MLFATPHVDDALRGRLDELDRLRERLSLHASHGERWLGRLRRQWRADSARSSVEIEGYQVTAEDAFAAAGGEHVAETDSDRMALSSYARAMDHVGAMADDPGFEWSERAILDLHFDACYFQTDKSPGRYREAGIEVTAPGGGPPAYIAPQAADVAPLMAEVVTWLNDGEVDRHPSVRAAMAHLHVVSIHPFRDGNGRISRIVQSLVLARHGPLAAEYLSIEGYLGRNTAAYYATLQDVQGGRYRPDRDAAPWVRFCVEAQIEQLAGRLDQIADASARWALLEALVERRAWPERLTGALQEALLGQVSRAAYAEAAGVSSQTATNDLRRLLDAGLLVQEGLGRSTRYRASAALRELAPERQA